MASCVYPWTPKEGSYDKGTDLIIQLHGIRTVFQSKRCKQTIDIRIIQEAHAAKAYHGADKTLVIISNKFSSRAKIFAKQLNVDLWDGKRLIQELKMQRFRL